MNPTDDTRDPGPKVYSHTLEPHGGGGWKLTYYIDGEYAGAASYSADEATHDHLAFTGREWDRIGTIRLRQNCAESLKEDHMPHPILYRAISEVLCWIRLATAEDENPAFQIAGISVSKNRPVENLSTNRLPSNISQPQILAHLLADLAHNWPDMAAGTNTFYTLTGAAMACRKLAEHSFNGEAWRTMIQPGLIELAAAFDQAGN